MVNGNPYRLTAEANLTSISVSVECINATYNGRTKSRMARWKKRPSYQPCEHGIRQMLISCVYSVII